MSALFEIYSVRQVAGEGIRRWFSSTSMDLFVWSDEAGRLSGFQLTYDKGVDERAFTWKQGRGYQHDRVDDGENHASSRYKETPLLRADGQPNIGRISDLLTASSANVPQEIVRFVAQRIRDFPLAPKG